MPKEAINKTRFIEEINKRLPTYEGYEGGQVVLNPAKTSFGGFEWTGPGDGMQLMARACREVLVDYDFDGT